MFSKSLILNDLKRFWWISVLFLAVMLISLKEKLCNFFIIGYHMSFIFGLFMGGLLFSYLHKNNAAACSHSMPLTIKRQYFSHLISGIIIFVIPLLIWGIGADLFTKEKTEDIMFYVINYMISCGCGLALSIFGAMISGKTVGGYFISIGCVIFAYVLLTMVNNVLQDNLYGYDNQIIDICGNIFKIIFRLENRKIDTTSLLFFVITIGISYWLYKIRPLEKNGDIIVFKGIRAVFIFALAFFVAYTIYIMSNLVLRLDNSFVAMFILGFATLVVSCILINRRIRGLWKYLLAYVALFAVIKGIFVFDLTGFEKYVPDNENVRAAIAIIEIDDEEDIATDKEENEKIIELHKYLIDEKNSDAYRDTVVKLRYFLEDGKLISRKYRISYNLNKEWLVEIGLAL